MDMKSKEGVLLGICTKKDDNLTISLDDQAGGRLRDFDKDKHGMVFVLRRFQGVPLLMMNADGSNRRPLPSCPIIRPRFAPLVARRRKLVLRLLAPWAGQDYYQSHVSLLRRSAAGQGSGDGTLPSMSPDSK